MFNKKTNFVKHIKQINHTINQNVRSLRLLKRTNFETKRSYSNNNATKNYLLLPQKLKIQACQNIPIYKFILSNVPHDQHPKCE